MSKTELVKQIAAKNGWDCIDVKVSPAILGDNVCLTPEQINLMALHEVRLTRANVALTPEESRLYEQFSVEQAQQAARHRPIASTDGKN